jgi:hypothetical protein
MSTKSRLLAIPFYLALASLSSQSAWSYDTCGMGSSVDSRAVSSETISSESTGGELVSPEAIIQEAAHKALKNRVIDSLQSDIEYFSSLSAEEIKVELLNTLDRNYESLKQAGALTEAAEAFFKEARDQLKSFGEESKILLIALKTTQLQGLTSSHAPMGNIGAIFMPVTFGVLDRIMLKTASTDTKVQGIAKIAANAGMLSLGIVTVPIDLLIWIPGLFAYEEIRSLCQKITK